MSDRVIVKELCEVLKLFRLQQNLTQEQLAERSGLSRSAISKMETGRTTVSLLTVVQVLRALQQFHLLNAWSLPDTISPLAVARFTAGKRFRASGNTRKKNQGDSAW